MFWKHRHEPLDAAHLKLMLGLHGLLPEAGLSARSPAARGLPPGQRAPVKSGEDALERGRKEGQPLRPDHQAPKWLALPPAARIGEMAEAAGDRRLCACAAPDRAPAIEIPIRPPVASLKRLWGHPGRLEDGVARVVEIPVAGDGACCAHFRFLWLAITS